MNNFMLGSLAVIAMVSINVSSLAAAPRSCEDNQVYLAVMESARNDLPAPYSGMDVKGSLGVTTLTNGQCKMKLFLVGGNDGQKEIDVLYNTTVPLSQIHVKLESPTEDTQESADKCTPIKFKRGHISGTVNGSVNPEESQCYTVATGANQTMVVTVTSREKNTVATILGVGDARDHFEFLTEKKAYQIDIFQLMRSAGDDAYSLTVTIR